MKKLFVGIILAATCLSCSRQQYVATSIQAQRYPLSNSNSDLPTNTDVSNLVAKYKQILDKEMNVVIGRSAQDMTIGRPESLLTNLTSDVMLNYAQSSLDKDCDLSFMNVHGHRADLSKGNITLGNVFEVYSFENTLSIVKLKGSYLTEAFESYAKMGGAGISSSVQLIIKDRRLVDATIDGKPVDSNRVYTIVTLDYLADGNDGLEALKKADSAIDTGKTLRDVMMNYIIEETKAGREISSKLDGRITIEK